MLTDTKLSYSQTSQEIIKTISLKKYTQLVLGTNQEKKYVLGQKWLFP